MVISLGPIQEINGYCKYINHARALTSSNKIPVLSTKILQNQMIPGMSALPYMPKLGDTRIEWSGKASSRKAVKKETVQHNAGHKRSEVTSENRD